MWAGRGEGVAGDSVEGDERGAVVDVEVAEVLAGPGIAPAVGEGGVWGGVRGGRGCLGGGGIRACNTSIGTVGTG